MSIYRKNLPPLNSLIAFEAVVRLRNISKAALEISRSQASVSRQIKLLEDNLNVTLFDRKRHNVEPNSYALSLYSSVKPFLDEVLKSSNKIRMESKGRNSLSIFSDISIANVLVSPVLGEFQRRHPDTQVKLISSFEGIENTSEVFDLGFQVGEHATNQFESYPIADDAIFPVCTAEFAKKYQHIASASELGALPLLHLDDLGRGWPDWKAFLESFGAIDFEVPTKYVFTTYDVCLEVAMRGEGVALGWARSVKPKIDEGKLVQFTELIMPLKDCIHVYLPKVAMARKKTIELLEIIERQLSGDNFG